MKVELYIDDWFLIDVPDNSSDDDIEEILTSGIQIKHTDCCYWKRIAPEESEV